MVGVNGWLERLDSQVGVTVWLDSKSNGEKGPILSSSALQTHTRKLLLSRVFETVEKDLVRRILCSHPPAVLSLVSVYGLGSRASVPAACYVSDVSPVVTQTLSIDTSLRLVISDAQSVRSR